MKRMILFMGVASSLLPLQVEAEDVASGWNLLGNASPPFWEMGQ